MTIETSNTELTNTNAGIAIYPSNAESIGNTPLIRINKLGPAGVTILVKTESRNPAGSVKCRIGTSLIADAEARGVLKKGITIIEPTSGNTVLRWHSLQQQKAIKSYSPCRPA